MTDDTTAARIEEIRARYTPDDGWFTHDIATLLAEVDRLTRWKNEALPVIDGLQELGRALDIPLGHSITGPDALVAVQQLQDTARHDAREIARLREEVRRARVTAAQTRLAQGVTEK